MTAKKMLLQTPETRRKSNDLSATVKGVTMNLMQRKLDQRHYAADIPRPKGELTHQRAVDRSPCVAGIAVFRSKNKMRVLCIRTFATFFAITLSTQLYAIDWRAFVEGAAKAAAESSAREAELERQKELLRYQYELEEKRNQQQRAIEEQRMRQQQAIIERRQREAKELERQQQIVAEEAKKKSVDAEKRNAMSTGTGFFIAPNGYLVTNAHVVKDYENITVKDQTGRTFAAAVIATDTQRDLALLKIAGTFSVLRIDQVGRPAKGQRVLTVGYPQVSIQGSESKVTDGIISSLSGIRNNDDWFQISVPIQGGNSGGPLINENGIVIGIVVATVNAQKFLSLTGNLPQNINYAIKAKVLMSFLAEQRIRTSGGTSKKESIESVDRATVLVIAKHGEPLVVAEINTVPALKPKVTTATETELRRENRAKVVSMHPDFDAIIADPDFDRWRKSLPEARRQQFDSSWDVDVISTGIADYKSFRKAKTVPPQGGQNVVTSENFRLGKIAYDRQDYPEAQAYFGKAAEQGNASAQVNLGFMYANGLGVTKDEYVAVGWYRKAASQGNAQAQQNLAFMYTEGRGVQKDDNEAVTWYRKAAEQGNASAQGNLGFMYANGRGVQKDDNEAITWYRKAAEQGNASAQNNLAFMYKEGRGVQKDDNEAITWYRKAADQGHEGAKTFLRQRGIS